MNAASQFPPPPPPPPPPPGGPTPPPFPQPGAPGSGPSGGNSKTVFVVVGVVVFALLALVVAVVAGVGVAGSGDDDDTAATDAGGPDAGTQADAALVGDPAPVTVTGDALDPLPQSGSDSAIGEPMPTISGTGFDGQPMTVPTTGRPTLVFFVAHWCPHCQDEVPVVQEWVDEGGLLDGLDLVTVSTAVSEPRGNYPPAAWLESEGWTAPVLADDADGTGATAAGLTGFPYFVAVNADGTVAARASGELTPSQLDSIVAELVGSAS